MIYNPTDEQVERLRASLSVLAQESDKLTRRFFTNLFRSGPAVRALFPADAAERSQEMLGSLGIVVKNIQRLEAIEHLLLEVGERNQRRGAQPSHYGMAREALVNAMSEASGDSWDEATARDWNEALNVVSSIMLRGAGRARRAA